MSNPHRSKTLTAALPEDSQAIFAWIADPENLPQWHSAFCRSVRRENGRWMVESPRGLLGIRFIRDDRALVLDWIVRFDDGQELTTAIRVLPNGDGSEIVVTLLKPAGFSEAAFQEQFRWIESALRELRKKPQTQREKPVAIVPEATNPKPETAPIPFSNRKLFIGNLSFDWSEDPLRELFNGAGNVMAAEIARFRKGGRSRGFGFVQMATEAEAQSAIEKFHGSLAGGRKIIVRLARSKENASGEGAAPETSRDSAPDLPPAPPPETVSVTEKAPATDHRPHRSPRGGRDRSARPGHSRPEVGITNSDGYEIFPRRAKGSAELPTVESREAPHTPRSSMEASPYFDDTGDIENRGNRRPRRRGHR